MKEKELTREIKEEVDRLLDFLESDIWSKFKPEVINGETYYREDVFENESDFLKYLRVHFSILKKQLGRIVGRS